MLMGIAVCYVHSRRDMFITDVCHSEWGAGGQSRTTQGRGLWKTGTDTINVPELRTVHLDFLPYLRSKHVLLRSDNASTVCYINHQGEAKSTQLLEVLKELLR